MARRKTKKSVRDASRKVENLENSCFTIMPFGERFDSYFEMVYKPAIIEAGLFPTRADDLYRPGTIISDIWMYTQKAKVVLADLAGKNPNVFYELGRLLQASKPTVLLISKPQLTSLPFDVRAFSILSYESKEKHHELIASVGSAIGKIRLALDPETRSKTIEAQTVSAKTLIVAYLDFEKIRTDAQGMLGSVDCETIEIRNFDTDSFKGWNQTLECPNGDIIVIIIDLNGDIVRVRKK